MSSEELWLSKKEKLHFLIDKSHKAIGKLLISKMVTLETNLSCAMWLRQPGLLSKP